MTVEIRRSPYLPSKFTLQKPQVKALSVRTILNLTMMMQSTRKPPLPRSPINLRLRSRRPLQSTSNSNIQTTQTPPGSLAKAQWPKSACEMERPEIRPEYNTISCELTALAKMVGQDFSSSSTEWGSLSASRSPLFERGRFYEEYSARRNERLRRKKGETGGGGEGKKAAPVAGNHYLGVRVESAKRRDTTKTKRFENLRKTVPCTPLKDRVVQGTPAPPLPPPSSSRYLLRSSISRETKKTSAVNVERSTGIGEKKIGVRRGRRI